MQRPPPRVRPKVLCLRRAGAPVVTGGRVARCSCLVALRLPVTARCISLEISVRQVSRRVVFCLLVFQLPKTPALCNTSRSIARRDLHSCIHQGAANKFHLFMYTCAAALWLIGFTTTLSDVNYSGYGINEMRASLERAEPPPPPRAPDPLQFASRMKRVTLVACRQRCISKQAAASRVHN